MKKSLLLLTVIFSFLLVRVSAENILILTNSKSQEADIFHKGSYLVFELKADKSVHEGFIREIKDSSLVFDDSDVLLSQITIFAGSTKAKIVAGKVANAISNTLLLAGIAAFDCGADLILYNDYYYWPIGGTVWLAGAFVAGLGYAFEWATFPFDHAVRVRNYREWNAKIIASPINQTTGQPLSSEEKVNQEKISQKQDSVQTVPAPGKSTKEQKKKEKFPDDVYGE